MSLILEALRRSEAERRRAAPPALLGDTTAPGKPTPSPWPIALAGLAVGVLLAGGGLAWFLRAGAAHAPVDARPATAPTAPMTPTPREPIPAAAYATSPTPAPAPAIGPPPVPPLPVPPTPVAEETSTGPRPGDLPLDTLLGAQREALPPLRLSMHVYADDPSRRFAIVDGQRVREGDTIGPGVQVLAIQRDGLRLAWNGHVVWMPR